MVKDLKGVLWKTVTRRLGKRCGHRPFQMGSVKILVCPHICSPKGDSPEKGLKIRWIGHILWISISCESALSPATSVTEKWAHEQVSVAAVRLVHRLSNVDFHSPRPIWKKSLLSAQYSNGRNQWLITNLAQFPG